MGRRICPTAGGSEWDRDSDTAGSGPACADSDAWMMVDGSASEPEEVKGALGRAATPPVAVSAAPGGSAAHTPNHPAGLATARQAALTQLAPQPWQPRRRTPHRSTSQAATSCFMKAASSRQTRADFVHTMQTIQIFLNP
jgi:hypothetical protein